MRYLAKEHAENNHSLNKILHGRLKRLGRDKTYTDFKNDYFWPADFFNLHLSKLFLEANAAQQHEILSLCSRDVLLESYFIEKSGLAYCAKQILAAETTEIAQAYSLMAADEATHLQWMTPYTPVILRTQPDKQFLFLLENIIAEGSSQAITYLLQIILEGWGLHHYQHLADGCLDKQLTSLLKDIVRDEALHHQTGIIVFDIKKITQLDYDFIEMNINRFLELIRAGSVGVIHNVERVLGHLSPVQRLQLQREIRDEETTLNKLRLLKNLMNHPGCEIFLEKIEKRNLFTHC